MTESDALPDGDLEGTAAYADQADAFGELVAEKYKILQKIGEGGMGAVYLARQSEPVRRDVALKIILPGMDSRQVLARFEAERQALAMLDHPNIARVFDAGTTDKGKPFFVMELIKGVPITQFCNERRLPIRARLDLFVQVCHAIQHAHQKGIIHRDIKPSNVLVAMYDDKPIPKVIDFGVAKATTQPLTERTMFTQYGAIVGTLEYMSPEQAQFNHLDVDTRSDIYSLGVLLYELLTGGTPFERRRLRSAAFDEMLRIIREEEPQKPSKRLSTTQELPSIAAQRSLEPRRLGALVRGDLDWIVMKCLEKDRARRYDAANGLAADLEHYMADEPVSASPPSVRYRLRKLVQRHRGAVITTSLLLLALVGGVVGTTWGWVGAVRSQKDAAEQRDKAKGALVDADAARQAAEKSAVESGDRLVRNYVANGVRLMDDGDLFGSLPWLVEAMRLDAGKPEREALHRLRVASVLRHAPPLTHLWVHESPVTDACLSPDGRLIASGHRDGVLRFRSLVEGHSPPQPIRCGTPITCVGFSSDGLKIAVGMDNERKPSGTLGVWNVSTGEPVTPLLTHGNELRRVSFSPDGKRLLTTCRYWRPNTEGPGYWLNDGDARVWNVTGGPQTGKQIVEGGAVRLAAWTADGTRVVTLGDWRAARALKVSTNEQSQSRILEWPQAEILNFVLSKDGALVLGISRHGTGRVWKTDSGSVVSTNTWSRFENGGISTAAFAPDGKTYLTVTNEAGERSMIRLWKTETGRPDGDPLPMPARVDSLEISPDGRFAAVQLADKTVRIVDLAKRQDAMSALLHEKGIEKAAFDAMGKRVITTTDQIVRVWDLSPPAFLAPAVRHELNLSRASFNEASTRIVTASFDGTVGVWDAKDGRPIVPRIKHSFYVLDACFSPDGTRVATASWDRRARVWDAETGRPVTPWITHKNGIQHVCFSRDGLWLATAGADDYARGHYEVRVWSALTGDPRFPAIVFPQNVFALAFSPDGTRLLTADPNGEIRLYDAVLGTLVGRPMKHGMRLCHAEFNRDGSKIVSASIDGTAQIWDAVTNEKAAPPIKHFGAVLHAAFNADASRIVTASADRTARVWNAVTSEPQTAPLRHNGVVRQAAFSPDGRLVVTSGSDGVGGVWDSENGERVMPWLTHDGAVDQASFSPDGRLIVTASNDGTARVWTVAASEPADALSRRVAVTVAHRVDPMRGVIPLSAKELAEAWDGAQKNGTNRSGDEIAWHRAQAADAEAAEEWFAALWHTDRMIAAEPEDWRHRAARVRLLIQSNDGGKALTELGALSRNPGLTSGAMTTYLIEEVERLERQEQGTFDETRRATCAAWARTYLDFMATLNLDDSRVWRKRAAVHMRLKDHKAALKDYSRALEIDPNDASSRLQRAELHVKTEQWVAASDDYAHALKSPKTPATKVNEVETPARVATLDDYYHAALAALAADNENRFGEWRGRVWTQFGGDPAAMEKAAWVCVLSPHPFDGMADVVAKLKQSAAGRKQDTQVGRTLGAALLRNNDAALAAKQLEAVLAIRNEFPTAWLFLAMARHRLGDHAAARSLLAKAAKFMDGSSLPNGPSEHWSQAMRQLSWDERLKLQILRREADKLILGDKPVPSPK